MHNIQCTNSAVGMFALQTTHIKSALVTAVQAPKSWTLVGTQQCCVHNVHLCKSIWVHSLVVLQYSAVYTCVHSPVLQCVLSSAAIHIGIH